MSILPSWRRLKHGFKWLALLAIWAGYIFPSALIRAEGYSAMEGELRAAVTVGVLRFTSWNDRELLSTSDELSLCLVGSPISEPYLVPANGVAKVGKKNLNVSLLGGEDWSQCHSFVIGSKVKQERVRTILSYAQANNSLTVCDGCAERVDQDMMITLRLDDQRVRFEVNLAKALAANIRLDASLLELASQVRK